MTEIYEEYFQEIYDKDGHITDVEIHCPANFNFAYDVMDRHAKERPTDVALVHKSAEGNVKRFTYEEIRQLSNKAANVFRVAGIGRGDSVMLLLKDASAYSRLSFPMARNMWGHMSFRIVRDCKPFLSRIALEHQIVLRSIIVRL